MLRTCQRRARTPRPHAPHRGGQAAQLRPVRVGRARVDALVGVFEHRLEEQSGTGEIERAVDGAELDLWV